MAARSEVSREAVETSRLGLKRRVRGFLILLAGGFAVAIPFLTGSLALLLVAVLLIGCGILEMLETFHAPDESRRRSAYLSGAVSVGAGLLLLAQPQLVLRGLALLLAASFLIDGVGKIVMCVRGRPAFPERLWILVAGLVNLALALVLVTRWPVSGLGVVEVVVGIRMLTAGWAMLLGRDTGRRAVAAAPAPGSHPDHRLSLPPHPQFASIEESLKTEDEGRRRIDAYWCATFVVVFLAIHLGRMNLEWSLLGMISPVVAVFGDVCTALLVAFGMILPCRLAWRKLTRPLERCCWERVLKRDDEGRGPGLSGRLCRRWLVGRMHLSMRMARISKSPPAALSWGLQVGLPVTAILIAVNPIWGFSWFFNSESWTVGIWDRWAQERTDTWREQMFLAVRDGYRDTPADRLFRVEPEGIADSADFSFLVLGDTGQGGGSQHCLRDQYLFLGERPDVKFMVISSDVIYPAGAMRDYEPHFYLPFKGFSKPIYAIPGNHDWYDALEAFAANFLEADAARASMRARVLADGRFTSTTDRRIDGLIAQAAHLRSEFSVSTGWQRGPFFEVQMDRFALIAVDTGVLRRVDTLQWDWLRGALDRARGKFTIAILGHPLYAGGRYQGEDEVAAAGEWEVPDNTTVVLGSHVKARTEPFAAIHRLLREHQVEVVMAGDTHDFEHYRETYQLDGAMRTMYHFVNGGGGAYMSIGTPLDWPQTPAVPDCAFYPRTDTVVSKLDRETPAWKWPLWMWAKRLRGWPLSAETMAGAFDYNRAPYVQSFVEVQVRASKDEVRLIPHGANGPLRWRELETFGSVVPDGKTGDDFVEFVIAMPRPTN